MGNSQDAVTDPFPGLVLMGGGRDVDSAFKWMIDKSDGGDFVVIRASGTDAYNSYIFNLGKVDSVETLVVYRRQGAYNDFVVNQIDQAEAVFIAGGNQADYINLWKDTPLAGALNNLLARGVPVGGTSAGLAVLGEFVFSALKGTVYSEEALTDPFHHRITLDQHFITISLLSRVITDSHFSERDRMGRLVVFMARIMKDYGLSSVKGMGLDSETALLVSPDGSSTVSGTGSVYFLFADHRPEVCQNSVPLSFSDFHVYKIRGSAGFDLSAWQGFGGVAYFISAVNGNLVSTAGSIY